MQPTHPPLHAVFCPEVTGLVLAGGRATRMQERDKGLQEFKGQRLIDHVLTRLAPQVDTVLINVNRNQEVYDLTGYPIVSDILTDFQGPLAGLEAGLLQCKTPYLLTVPCDAPYLPPDLASRLMAKLNHSRADIAMACSGEPDNLQRQPVFCLLKAIHLTQLQHYLRQGGRKMDSWFGTLPLTVELFSDPLAFTNLNTLEELQQASELNN